MTFAFTDDAPRLARNELADRLLYAVADDNDRLFTACLEETEGFEILMSLCDDRKGSLLTQAVHQGAVRVLAAWKSFGLNPEGWTGRARNSLLHEAALGQHEGGIATSEWLIENYAIPLTVRNAFGQCPLEVALEKGSPAMTQWLAERMAEQGLLSEFVSPGAMPKAPALATGWRVGALIAPSTLPREAKSWLQGQAEIPADMQPSSLWLTALSSDESSTEPQGGAEALRLAGLQVPATLAFDVWDARQRQPYLGLSVAWALGHGAAHTHPHDGRRLIDLLLADGQLHGAHSELKAGHCPAAESVLPLVDLAMRPHVLDCIALAFEHPKDIEHPKDKSNRRDTGRMWVDLWDGLPKTLNDNLTGLDVPESLQPFFEPRRWPARRIGTWLSRMAGQHGRLMGEETRQWRDMVKAMADTPVASARRPRL